MTLPTAEELARIVEYVAQYGGRCRDCADEDGICPSSGLACDTAVERKAIKFVVERLQYGVGHGFIRSPFEGGRSMDAKDVDQAFQAWWAIPATFDSDEHLSRMAFEAGFLASRPTTPEAQVAEGKAEPLARTGLHNVAAATEGRYPLTLKSGFPT
jgi:hypothetical protein